MKQSSGLIKKMLLIIGVPVAIVFAIIAGVSISSMSETAGNQSQTIMIYGLGFILVVLIIIFAARGIDKKISDLTRAAEYLAAGDVDAGISALNTITPLGGLSGALGNIAENIKSQSEMAQRIADGDSSKAVYPSSDKDVLGKSLESIQKKLQKMAADVGLLSSSATRKDFDKRADASQYSGDFNKIVKGFNQTLDTVVDHMYWYEAIIDGIPFPVHVTDNDMKWTFMNKSFESLMIANGVIKDRDGACGMDCYNAGANICRTEGCGIRRLVDKSLSDSYFEWVGRNNKQDTAYLINRKGEKIGFVEIVTDLTSIISVSNYTNTEVERLENNLLLLSKGDLNFDMNIAEPGEYTGEVSSQFNAIGKSLGEVKTAIGNLIGDATMITNAAIGGQLDNRADAEKFEGSWKTLVVGMNDILEEIAKPLEEVSNVMHAISNGNLQTKVTGDYQGDFDELKNSVNNTVDVLMNVVGEIANVTTEISESNLNLDKVREFRGDFVIISNALNAIIDSLNVVLGDINDAAEQVAAGSTQVSAGSQSLAQGSTEQASSVQELTASIAEIADQTKSNAMDANKARELATTVRDNAEKGDAQMSEMQDSMVAINQSSEDISKIIKVIDDIAFQTNILALNAAVEAARAGQHGKGFAVVAEEVRNLAARSADAAKETTILIEGSIDKVQVGTKIADDTAKALNEIVEGIEKVTDLVGNISVATNEQASGIAQIDTGVEQVAHVVQQNSATAEESAAASEQLSSQAEMLKQMIARFQLKRK